MTCHARALGAQKRPVASPSSFSTLCCNGCPHTLVSSNPTPWEQCRLVPSSCYVGLSPPLSLSRSPVLSLSLLLFGPPPIAPHSLSLPHKGVFAMFGGSLSPPGFEPSSEHRRGTVYLLSYDELLSALLFRPVLRPPACHPLSGIWPLAWGCAQQRVEEPHSVPGYRVRLAEERSLEEP